MNIDYAKLKADMVAAGHIVSSGVEFLASDLKTFYDYAHFTLQTTSDLALMNLAGGNVSPSITLSPVIMVQPTQAQIAAGRAAMAAPMVEPEPTLEPVAEPEQQPATVEQTEPVAEQDATTPEEKT